MSYPNYPNNPYPGYPQQQPGYPPQQPSYPPQQPQYPGYPPAQPAAPYPGGYPQQQPAYPGGYPTSTPYAPTAGAYPPQQQPAYYPSPAPTFPQYNPTGPQQQYPAAAPYPGGPQPSGPYPGGFPSSAPYAPAPSAVLPQQPMEQNIPTVLPASPFDARADADALHKAMKGLGTNEAALITVLCHRTSQQRAQIYQAYKSGYGKDLDSKLKSELSGNFEKVMVALALPRADYMAKEMYSAVSGIGTTEGTLVEILCSGTNQEIREMNAAYLRLYGHPLEKDIKGDTSGTLKMLLVSLSQGQRDENQAVDINKAKEDAQRLYQAGEAKMGTDESAFNAILATRSWAHLRQVIAEYQAIRGNTLEKAVMNEFSANAEKGLLGILQCAQSPASFFAGRLNNAIRGLGTKDNNLIRIIVTRCDVDLGNIKREYEKKYGRSLATDVAGDTSGDYKKALLALIN